MLESERIQWWYFIQSGKYTVKYGYALEYLYPNRGRQLQSYGPTTTTLWAHSWKIKYPSIWRAMGFYVICCEICGAEEESINHVLFECPPTIKIWAFVKNSNITRRFSMRSVLQTWIICSRWLHLYIEDANYAWIYDLLEMT